MHQCITHQEWALLAKTHEQAVIKAFRRRYRAEAIRSGVVLTELRDREDEIKKKGVKRVDLLLGKTVFKGLVWTPGDPPGWLRVVTA
jgi:hypothetical protein